MHRALAIDEKSFGPDHPNVARDLNNLAELLRVTNRLHEAEPLMRRALAIDEKSFGPDHPNVAIRLNNLALLLQATNRLTEAEMLYHRAVAIDEKSLGRDHPTVARDLNNLAWLHAMRDDWTAAAALGRRAKPILVGRGGADSDDRNSLGKALLASNTWALRAHARAIYRASAESDDSREEGFELAQWALQTSAAQALSQMSARLVKGAGPLAQLVRQRQDFVARREAEDKHLLAAVGRGSLPAAEILARVWRRWMRHLMPSTRDYRAEFKEYAELSNPKPLTIAAAQVLLNDGEALVLFLDVPQSGNVPGETLIWVVTKTACQMGAHQARK